MDNLEFANRITEMRKQKGLSQKELGDMLGVSNKAVSKWENGEAMPKTSTMLKLAELLGIDGNELIGFEVREASEAQYNKDEIAKLKSENSVLSSRLNAIEERRKRTLVLVAVICIISVIASGIIAFCFRADNSINSELKDAGKDGTKIVFANKSYAPADKLGAYMLKERNADSELFWAEDSKYAVYYDLDSKEHKALIDCSSDTEYVVSLSKGKKEYYYVSSDFYDAYGISLSNLLSMTLYGETITDSNYYESNSYSNIEKNTRDEVNTLTAFCKFYNDKGKPVDKSVTEHFLGKKPRRITVTYRDYNELTLGEFFKDDKGNAYFYDYVDTCSYSVGEELSAYVY